MSKIIAVIGATGSQGGGVVNILKKTPGWKVKAITRNTQSDSAKKLVDEGVEIAKASLDDEASLVEAFKDVNAVFAVTDWWQHLFSGKSPDEAGELEEEQGMKVARAAAQTASLEHYIWSTEPSPKRQFQGKITTPHWDYKANVDERIKRELPELAAKTTYLYLGFYPQNFFNVPFYAPIEYPPMSGTYIQMMPAQPDTTVLNSGDISVNPGLWVRQILAKGASTFGKYTNVALERLSYKEMMSIWSEVMGKKGIFIPCSGEHFEALWGPAGAETSLQLEYGEACDPWEENENFLGIQDLDLDPAEVVGFRATIEKWKNLS